MYLIEVIFEALGENTGLKASLTHLNDPFFVPGVGVQDLKVNFQACAKQSFRDLMLEQGNDVYKAAAAAFRSNRSLVKLDLPLPELPELPELETFCVTIAVSGMRGCEYENMDEA